MWYSVGASVTHSAIALRATFLRQAFIRHLFICDRHVRKLIIMYATSTRTFLLYKLESYLIFSLHRKFSHNRELLFAF